MKDRSLRDQKTMDGAHEQLPEQHARWKGLSGEQAAPLLSSAKHCVIVASAGSGKTRTLAHMVADALARGVPASSIIAFTFTEKAGGELMARLHRLVQSAGGITVPEGLFIGTIHGWCLKYLIDQSDYVGFTPLDELSTEAMVGRLYRVLGLEDVYGLEYPRGIGKFLRDLEVFYNESLELGQVPSSVRPAIETFLDLLRKNRLLTFGDMIREATRHLQVHGPLATLDTLFVDEYQDVNPAQVVLIKAMAGSSSRVAVVGDELQCIYNWRGSDVERIVRFESEFSPADRFILRSNYRSNPGIVDVANAVAASAGVRFVEKEMLPVREAAGPQVAHLSTPSEQVQAQQVAVAIKNLIAVGHEARDIAVLLRSAVRSGPMIMQALGDRGVSAHCPALSVSGGFVHEFVLPLFDWLRRPSLAGRSAADEASETEELEAIWAVVAAMERPRGNEDAFWDVLHNWKDQIRNSGEDAYNVRASLYNLLEAAGIAVGPKDHMLIEAMGVVTQIIRSVEEVERRRLRGLQRRAAPEVIAEVFFALRRFQNGFAETLPLQSVGQSVLVTTVHQAKGLEWPVVIVAGLNQRVFPLQNRRHVTSYADGVAGRYGTTQDDERRLFYVAVTRAKDRLILVDFAGEDTSKRSVFLNLLADQIDVKVRSAEELPAQFLAREKAYASDAEIGFIGRIGLSDLLLYMDCPFQYGLRRVAGVQPAVGQELGYGKGLHEIVQRRLKSARQWTEAEIDRETGERVHLPYMSEAAAAKATDAIAKSIMNLQSAGAFDEGSASEVQIQLVFPTGVVEGIVDCVGEHPDGSITITDWKASVHEEYRGRYKKQVQLYAAGLSAAKGIGIKQAQVVDVKKTSSTGRLSAVTVEVEPNTLQSLMKEAEAALERLTAGDFGATPSRDVCMACDVNKVCGVRWTG